MKKFIIKSNENFDDIKEPWRMILILSVFIIIDAMMSCRIITYMILGISISLVFVLWRMLYEMYENY